MVKDFIKLFGCIIACELIGILGTPLTIKAIPTWYAGLKKPFFAPPNWIFGPVWTLLYCLMGISVYLIAKKGLHKKTVRVAVIYFLAQLILNFLWSPIFFGLKSPLLGLITIVSMWIFILITMKKFYVLSRIAFYLLIPYLAWVTLATVLNASIFVLN